MHTEMDKDLTQAGDDDVDAEGKQLRHKVEGEFFVVAQQKYVRDGVRDVFRWKMGMRR